MMTSVFYILFLCLFFNNCQSDQVFTKNKINSTNNETNISDKKEFYSSTIPPTLKNAGKVLKRLKEKCKLLKIEPCNDVNIDALIKKGDLPDNFYDTTSLDINTHHDRNDKETKNTKDISNLFITTQTPENNTFVYGVIHPKSNCPEGFVADKRGVCREEI